MKSGITVTGIKAAQARLANLNKAVTRATAASLNQVARLAATEANAAMPSVFTRANSFTQRAVFAPADLAARSDNLTAVVGIRPLQAKYLSFEILGGVRTPADNTRLTSRALTLPGQGQQPLPSNFVKRLAAQVQAQQARRQAVAAGQRKARKGAGSSGVFKLSGPGPHGQGVGGFFRRLPNHHLVRLVAFEPQATYRPKFDFTKQVEGTVARNLSRILAANIARAIAASK